MAAKMAATGLNPALKKRLTYLRDREALAAVVLFVLISWEWLSAGGDIAWGLRVPALVLFTAILLQGTFYWHLKLRSLENHTSFPAYFPALFTAFKWLNAIAIGAILMALGFASRTFATPSDLGWTAALLAGAVLEQINYFYYQLMYDTRAAFDYLRRNKRLRKAALGLDIARSKQAAVGGDACTDQARDGGAAGPG